MAAAFSAHSLSFSPSPVFAHSASKTLKPLFPALQLRFGSSAYSVPAFRNLYPSQSCRKSSRAELKVGENDHKIINGNEENQAMDRKSENATGRSGNMKALIQAYRQAILSEDENSVPEIEASICILEKEKDELSLKLTKLMEEIASRKDMFLRVNADFENFRKRSEKDHATFTSDIRSEVIECLLPMVDSFEQSKQQMKPETEKEKKIDASYQGIYKQFVEIMRSMHVSVVETVGRPFDPSIHEAIAREESQQFKSGTVTQELRRGFVLGQRVLRPASVKVSTGPRKQPGAAAEPIEDPAAASSKS